MKKSFKFLVLFILVFIFTSCFQGFIPFYDSDSVSINFRVNNSYVGNTIVVSVMKGDRELQTDKKLITSTDSNLNFEFTKLPVGSFLTIDAVLYNEKNKIVMKGSESLKIKKGNNFINIKMEPFSDDSDKPVVPDPTPKPNPIKTRFVLWNSCDDDNVIGQPDPNTGTPIAIFDYPKYFFTEGEPDKNTVLNSNHFIPASSGNQVFDFYIDDTQYIWDYQITGGKNGQPQKFRIGKMRYENAVTQLVKEIDMEFYTNLQNKQVVKYLYSNIYKYDPVGEDVILLSGFDYSSGKNIIYYYFDNEQGTGKSGVVTLPSENNIGAMAVNNQDLYYVENGAGFVVKKVAGFADKIKEAAGDLDWSKTNDVTVLFDGTDANKVSDLGLDCRMYNIKDLKIKDGVLFALGIDNNLMPDGKENATKRSKGFLLCADLSVVTPTLKFYFLRRETQEEIDRYEPIYYSEAEYENNFLGPRKFVNKTADKLVIADDGVFYDEQSNQIKSKNRIVIIDVSDLLDMKIERTIELDNVTFDGYINKKEGPSTELDYVVNVRK